MTAEGKNAEVRELRHRIREVRTENAELKVQYRRWLIFSVCLSVLSLLLAFLLVFIGAPVITLPENNSPKVHHSASLPSLEEEDDLPVVHEEESDSLWSDLALPDEDESLEEPITEKEPSSHFASLPLPDDLEDDLVEDTHQDSSAELATVPPPRKSGGFALPGNSQATRKVIHYTVKKNDSLWLICKRYFSRPTPGVIRKIKRDNSLVSDRIEPGMKLVLIIDEH